MNLLSQGREGILSIFAFLFDSRRNEHTADTGIKTTTSPKSVATHDTPSHTATKSSTQRLSSP
jgi:hypothetical protein